MTLMMNLRRNRKGGGVELRLVIPAAVRDHIVLPHDIASQRRGVGEIKLALGVLSDDAANAKAAPIILRIKEAIANAKTAARDYREPVPLTVDLALAAISIWLDKIRAGHDPGWWQRLERGAPAYDVLRHMEDPHLAIPDFEGELVLMLEAEGLTNPVAAIPHHRLTPVFCAWGRAYAEARHLQMLAHAEMMERQRAERLVQAANPQPTTSGSPHRISAVLERWLAFDQPKEAKAIRYYVRRLIEAVGDVPVGDVRRADMTAFLITLRQMPAVRSGALMGLSLDELIDRAEEDDLPLVTGKTLRTKWFSAYRRLFLYAMDKEELISRSPVIVPPKKLDGSATRRAFTADEISDLFKKPLFSGYQGEGGYRSRQGDVVTQDARYWLPVLGLWSGMRLEEMGAAKTAELVMVDGVECLDLRDRKLKTPQSRRLVPLHSKLMAAGFRSYIEARRTAGDEWLFPDLPHDQPRSTNQFGKWWGHWMSAAGFEDPSITFHSLRHSFKRACRDAGLDEEKHDLLTGHKGSASVGRGYGSGMSIKPLAEAIERVDFPTFHVGRSS